MSSTGTKNKDKPAGRAGPYNKDKPAGDKKKTKK